MKAEEVTMAIRIDGSSQQLNLEGLAKLKSRLQCVLSKDYEDFLLKFNGGKPEPNVLIGHDGRATVGITRFLGEGGDKPSLLDTRQTYEGRVPSDLLPIALAEGGNLVCLGIRGRRVGLVYFWDHERESPEGHKPGYANVSKIADGFRALLERLKPLKPEDVRIQDGAVKETWVDPEFLKEQKRLGNA